MRRGGGAVKRGGTERDDRKGVKGVVKDEERRRERGLLERSRSSEQKQKVDPCCTLQHDYATTVGTNVY